MCGGTFFFGRGRGRRQLGRREAPLSNGGIEEDSVEWGFRGSKLQSSAVGVETMATGIVSRHMRTV